MKMKSKIVLAIATIAFLCLVGWSSKAQRLSNPTWEYKLITVYGYPELPTPNLEKFNDLGAEGWELVMVFPEEVMRADKRHLKLVYYFKRRT